MAAALDDAASTGSPTSSTEAREAGDAPVAPRVADDRAADPEGLDLPAGRRTASRWRARSARTRCRCPAPAPTTSTARVLEAWLRSYRPEELFDDARPTGRRAGRGSPRAGDRRMSANPVANGGAPAPGPAAARLARLRRRRSTRPAPRRTRRRGCSGSWLRDVTAAEPGQLPDLRPGRAGQQPAPGHPRGHRPPLAGRRRASTTSASTREGRVVEILSEHVCQGLLEGYLLTGRHGVFTCYEAFIHIVDSMFNQHAKWLEASAEVPWRRPLASLNYLLSSHVWRQDHNGSTHQDPGFLDVVMNKKPAIVRVYLPPDANTLLSTYDHCLRSRHYVNVVVAGKQPQADWLDAERGRAALRARRRHLGAGPAPTTTGDVPDVVLACAGDVPTLETLAAASILRTHLPDLRVRVVNVVDLMRLLPDTEHPHGHARPGVRQPVHHRPAGDLRLPRLPVADPPAHLPAAQPRRTCTCAGYKERRHHHDTVRHGDAQRPRPLPPGHGRHRPGGRPRCQRGATCARRWWTPGCGPGPGRGRTARTSRRWPTGRGRHSQGGCCSDQDETERHGPLQAGAVRLLLEEPHRAAEVAGAAPHVAQAALAALCGQPLCRCR